MPKIRVLVVDDSVVIRKVVSSILTAAPGIEVAGTAANGKIALAKIDQLNPDLITLDIDMPVMGGLETLAEIRKERPHLPVVIVSGLTARGAEATFDALALGASAYVTKPLIQENAEDAISSVRDDLIPLVRGLCQSADESLLDSQTSTNSIPFDAAAASGEQKRVDILAIGVSTGGPNALAELMPALPADIPVPIVIVQHMPPVFTQYLAKRLNGDCKIQVREGVENATLEPGTCWIAPGDFHMTVEKRDDRAVLGLNEGPQENHCRPAVDVLFRSVAETFGARSLSLVMTGMGQDGLLGCKVLREKGGQVLAQNEESSVIWGMPGCVSRAGLAEKTLPLSELGREIMERVAFGRRRSSITG
ncbi:MAG: chemotaxis response regulator protein-glutamate methylesterase [Myxococcota bacterium]